MPNRLITSTSPYLLAHANDPVDWYPWGPEALERARAEDKPIHLSVGYHACHWCHVLHHESFSDPVTAAVLNDNYVNIKVDREERPDIDAIYMTAVQALTGGGGWPMTVFMTPDGVPFYGGTYFPPADRGQLPAFRRVLLGVANAYATQREDLLQNGRQLTEHIRAATATTLPGELNLALLDEAYAGLHGQFDQARGGFGHAPKFPQPMIIEFLLRYALRTGRPLAAEMATTTLRAMAEGGMYDQLGGGFHRYSVDADWLVPHFEKMLYDNALLARVYVEAYQATADPFFRRVAEETLDYLLREMRHPDGGFYSTQDADSLPTPDAPHAEEGAFFVWSAAAVKAALGSDALAFSAVYDVTERGNFEGNTILHIKRQVADVARTMGMDPAVLEQRLRVSRSTLLTLRSERPRPNLDDKVLTAWNGMAIRAFATAATVFERPDYAAAASAAADVMVTTMRPDGELIRSWRDTPDGPRAGTAPGFLEDYALLADGLLALYEATFDARWLHEATALADTVLERFWDSALGGFYDTAASHEALLVRPRDTGDNATPSGSSAAADVLLRLGTLLDRPVYRERALSAIGVQAELLARYPQGFGRFLAAAEYALASPLEIVVVGAASDPATQALLAVVRRPFLPHKVVALLPPEGIPFATPLFDGRTQLNGQPTAYVCQNYACQLPVTDPAALRSQIER